ncbi:protein of unknown function [Bradyrhizobium vignae]|uniref:Uncharacterized protein n=1 Tax=Bradyrhizobium vignae TaxID=1549949 RepID=A0A2U3PXP2_9BRAD|nr:protein of unknown function [Bradyrhizobium vignae]
MTDYLPAGPLKRRKTRKDFNFG